MANILLADDHVLVRNTIATYLESVDGFNVETAADLTSTLDLMRGVNSVDLVILDYHMPGMDGLDGIKRTLQTFPATKVVLMSGTANLDVARKAMDLGASGFIPSSLTVVSLVNAIKFVLAGERYFPFEFGTSQTAPVPPGVFASLS